MLLPVISAALNALELKSVSEPVQGMLDTFLGAIPALVYAAVILGVAFVVGRLVAGLVSDLLQRLGFDNILGRLGLSRANPESIPAARRPSALMGKIVMIAIMLFASMEALDKLNLGNVSELVENFLHRAGGWVMGALVFGLGLWVADWVAKVLRDRGTPTAACLHSRHASRSPCSPASPRSRRPVSRPRRSSGP